MRVAGRLARRPFPILCLVASLGSGVLLSCATSREAALALEWYELGNSWLDKSEWKRAGEAYRRALALDPKLASASFNMARALAEAKDYEAALKVVDELDARDPGNVRVLSIKAYVLFKLGETAKSVEVYDDVLRLDPFAPDAVYNAALLRATLGEKEAAVVDLERLLSVKPEDGQALLLLARLDEDLSRDEDAIAAFEKVRTLGKADGAALERLGALYEKARRYSDAIEVLEAATKADAKRALSWFVLAKIRLAVAEDGTGGLEALRKALDAGFADRALAAALLEEPVLAEREAVNKILQDKGLLGEAEKEATPGPPPETVEPHT